MFDNFTNRLVSVVMQARELLSKLGDLEQTQIFAKIENIEVSFILVFKKIV